MRNILIGFQRMLGFPCVWMAAVAWLLDVLLPHFDISSHLPISRDSRRVGHLDGAIEVFGCPEVWLS